MESIDGLPATLLMRFAKKVSRCVTNEVSTLTAYSHSTQDGQARRRDEEKRRVAGTTEEVEEIRATFEMVILGFVRFLPRSNRDSCWLFDL